MIREYQHLMESSPVLWYRSWKSVESMTDETTENNNYFWWIYLRKYTKTQSMLATNSCPYRILIVGGSGSGKTNALLNLIIKHQQDIDKICLYGKDLY